MALLGFEGAETKGSSNTLWSDEYSPGSSALTATPGRLGVGRRISSGNFTTRPLTGTPSTLVFGFGVRVTSQTFVAIVTCSDAAGVAMCTLTMQTSGAQDIIFRLLLGTTGAVFLTTAPFTITDDFWRYVQVKVTFATGATGSAEIIVDAQAAGTTTATNVQTSNSGIACSHLKFSAGTARDLDDIYWLDTTGLAPYNTFLGPVTTEGINPSGLGALAEWTPNAGANWDRVDDGLTTDDDTTYVSTAALNITDTHVHTDLTFITGGVLGLKVQTRARLESVGTQNVRHVYRNGAGTNTSGPTTAVATTEYDGQTTIWATNPNTGAAWTVTEINAGEFGYETLA